MDIIEWPAIIIVSYLIGAIPTAYVVGLLHGINIFAVGSGNMGAANVGRAVGPVWGVLVWIFDTLKGIAVVLIARHIEPSHFASVLAAIVAILGHNWSAFVLLITGRLRGGKGASVTLGTLIVFAPTIVAVLGLIGAVVLALSRYMSLAVLVMFGLATPWLLVLVVNGDFPTEYALYALGLLSILLYRFRGNINRLVQGTERRIDDRV
jgi:glycerol-3-phosphate acyltransferase PlsY